MRFKEKLGQNSRVILRGRTKGSNPRYHLYIQTPLGNHMTYYVVLGDTQTVRDLFSVMSQDQRELANFTVTDTDIIAEDNVWDLPITLEDATPISYEFEESLDSIWYMLRLLSSFSAGVLIKDVWVPITYASCSASTTNISISGNTSEGFRSLMLWTYEPLIELEPVKVKLRYKDYVTLSTSTLKTYLLDASQDTSDEDMLICTVAVHRCPCAFASLTDMAQVVSIVPFLQNFETFKVLQAYREGLKAGYTLTLSSDWVQGSMPSTYTPRPKHLYTANITVKSTIKSPTTYKLLKKLGDSETSYFRDKLLSCSESDVPEVIDDMLDSPSAVLRSFFVNGFVKLYNNTGLVKEHEMIDLTRMAQREIFNANIEWFKIKIAALETQSWFMGSVKYPILDGTVSLLIELTTAGAIQ